MHIAEATASSAPAAARTAGAQGFAAAARSNMTEGASKLAEAKIESALDEREK